MVVPVAVSSARNSVFHATPQRTPPVRQFKPHTRSLPMRSKMAVIDQRPSSFKNAPYSALVTGKAMNITSMTAQPNTAEAMNKSPLKKPLRARPKAVIIKSASKAKNAPMPMPNWLMASSPNCAFRKANDQPLEPIVNAVIKRPRKPTKPPATNQFPCARPAGIDSPTAAITSPIKPTSNHLRPCTSACTMPLAVSGPPKICGSTLYQAVS